MRPKAASVERALRPPPHIFLTIRAEHGSRWPPAAPASLNIATDINLATYGYTNVYELGPLLDVATTTLRFDGSM